MYAFWSSHASSDKGLISKFQIILARTTLNSAIAIFCPRQSLAPSEKGRTTARLSRANVSEFSPCSQRSGRNCDGRAKLVAEWFAAYWVTPTAVYRIGRY
jgi:hypothetical protein